MRYPAVFETAEEGGYVVTFRDIPEAIAQGDGRESAMQFAEDALLAAMEFYFEDRRPVPMPSLPEDGEIQVELPPGASAKVLLLNEMLGQKVTASELARRLGTRPQDVQRLTNLGHSTKIDTIHKAMKCLGRRLEVIVA